jgi:hypothetical protein
MHNYSEMKDTDRRDIKKWVETWEKTGSLLDKVKLKELRAADYYNHNQVFLNEMLRYAFEHRETRLSSGLIEQQKIFMKLNKKQIREKHDS